MPRKNLYSSSSLSGPLLIVLLACFVVYFNSLFNGFVYDDNFQVLENPWIKDVRHLTEIFSTNVWSFRAGFSNYYRPLMHVIYMITYYIFGLSTWGFHLVNVLFHAGNSVLVFFLALALTPTSLPSRASSSRLTSLFSPSLVAAFLFAVHPIHTEAVAWVAGLPELSFTFFYLLSFYLYILSGEGRKGAYLSSLSAFFLAALCKEPALTLPVVLMAYDYACKRDSLRKFGDLKRYVPYFALAGVYLLIRYNILGGLTHRQSHAELSEYQYFVNVFPLFAQYIEKLLLPVNLNAFHVLHPISSIFEPRGLLSLAVAIVFAVFVFISSKKGGLSFFGLVLLVVPLVPALYIPGLAENAFTERYLYLPSAGFVLLIGLLLSSFSSDTMRRTLMAALLFIAVSGLYSVGTVKRNSLWKDDFTLWSETVRKAPDGIEPHNQFAYALLKQGRVDEAIGEFQIALKLNPNYCYTYNNLGVAYAQKGLPDKAIEYISLALKLEPMDANAHYNLGLAYMQKRLLEEAIAQFEEAVRLAPADLTFRNSLEKAYALKRREAQ